MNRLSNTAYLFSGQGSQYPGMGQEFYQSFPAVRELYDQAAQAFGFDVARLSFEGDAAQIAQTCVSQPLIYTMSLAVFEVAKSRFGLPTCVGGHSLGEYAAMTCAGVLSREDGFQVIKARAAAMQKAAEQSNGAMYAILGSSDVAIRDACANAGGYVVPVNYNSPAQTVIAGESASAEKAAALLSEQGAKAVKLAVNCAFHSKMMESAAEEFKAAVQNVAFHKPEIPFYSNLNGKVAEEITPDYLAKHLTSPVQFVTELQEMSRNGITTFLEIGPGKVLTGLVKKTLKEASAANLENNKTLEKAKALF